MQMLLGKPSAVGVFLKSIFLSSLLLPLAAYAEQSQVPNARTTESARSYSVKVTLITDKTTYKLGEKIVVQVLLTNKSKLPVYVYGWFDWGESASVSLWLKDVSSGKAISQTTIPDAISPPPGSKDDFVKLLPNHVYGVTLTTDLSELGAQKGGAYALVAQYHSPIPASMGYGLPILSRENGAISSNQILLKAEN